jgi:hypothetical protein
VISFALLRQASSLCTHVYLYTLCASLLAFLVLLASDNFLVLKWRPGRGSNPRPPA